MSLISIYHWWFSFIIFQCNRSRTLSAKISRLVIANAPPLTSPPAASRRGPSAPRSIHARQLARGFAEAYCVSGSWGAAFYRVSPEDGDLVLEKHRHSAFIGTGLDQALRDRGIRTVVVAGVQTHVCVESTLRDASARGYYVVVPGDCVGSFDRDLHDKTLRCVAMHFGEVVESADLVARWQ